MKMTKGSTLKTAKEKWAGRCSFCMAEFTATRSELRNIEYDSRENGELARKSCPACRTKDGVILYPVT